MGILLEQQAPAPTAGHPQHGPPGVPEASVPAGIPTPCQARTTFRGSTVALDRHGCRVGGMGWPRALTAAAAVPAALLAATGVTALAVSPAVDDAVFLALLFVASGVSFGCAFLISGRLPRHPVGPLLATNGVVVLLLVLDVRQDAAARRPDVLPALGGAAQEAAAGHWMLLFVPLAFVVLVFPDGGLPSRHWLPVAVGLLAVPAVFNAAIAAAALWPAARTPATIVATPLPLVLLLLLLAAAASAIIRHRHGDPATRQRLRWLAFAAATVPLTLLLCWLSYFLLSGPDLVLVGLLLVYLLLPTAALLALLRADRFDVDRLLLSTATYFLLGAALLVPLSVTSALAGLLIARWSTEAAVVVTVACTLLVLPVRARLRRFLGRWIYPERDRALAALEDLRMRMHRGEAQPEDVGAVLRVALRDPGLCVGYRPVDGGPMAWIDAVPAAGPGPGLGTAVRLAGQDIGVLVPGPDKGRRPSRETADAAGLFVELVRLRTELDLALVEIAGSRARILEASDRERRRLERDLHDGAQQRLVSLGMSLRLLQRSHGGVDGLADRLDAAVAQIGTAVSELRAVAHGLRPSSLDDGLEPALAGLARACPVRVELALRFGALPDQLATAAYFVAAEAVANAVRHAAPSRIRVSVTHAPGSLRVAVEDDGEGGAVVLPGAGLAGLRDRVETHGGSLQVTSSRPGGTVVEAMLPCA